MKILIKPLLIQIYYWVAYYIPGICREIIKGQTGTNSLPVISFLDTKWGMLRQANWGDDMNVYLCNELFHKQIICYKTSVLSWLFHRTNFALIGSILQSADSCTVVWGSGLHAEGELPKEMPKKICAVRGKLTRNQLIAHGFPCPEIFGDPILLLPRIYLPQVKKKYKVGIIPHFLDEDNPIINKFIATTPGSVLISMKHYQNWRDIVDLICSCEMTLSSSLHGLIVSDAYNIPNCWVEFSNKVYGNGFKFRDYFSSVGRDTQEAIKVRSISDIQSTIENIGTYQTIHINLKPLIESCPFKLPFHT